MIPTAVRMAQLVGVELRRQGMTQTQLAKQLGITQKHLSMVLNGRSHASLTMLDAAAEVLGTSWAVALGDRPTPQVV